MSGVPDVFEFIRRAWPKEARRIRYCRGCKYLGSVGDWGCCNYLIDTGKRRPNKFAVKDCAAYERIKNYVMPDDHQEYCRQCEELEKRKAAAQNKPKKKKPKKMYEDGRTDNSGNRIPKWDTAYGWKLYKEGYFIRDIATILGESYYTVKNYTFYHGWNQMMPPDEKRKAHDVKAARQEYLEYRKQHPITRKDNPIIEFVDPSLRKQWDLK